MGTNKQKETHELYHQSSVKGHFMLSFISYKAVV